MSRFHAWVLVALACAMLSPQPAEAGSETATAQVLILIPERRRPPQPSAEAGVAEALRAPAPPQFPGDERDVPSVPFDTERTVTRGGDTVTLVTRFSPL